MGYYKDEATLGDHIIAFLGHSRSISVYNRILYERVMARRKNAKISSIQSELSRLKKKGFVEKIDDEWKLTNQGSNFYKKAKEKNYIQSPFKPKSPDSLLLAFDIPETERRLRDWLRTQLKIFGYRMVQQSLWVGPGPLPTEFKERITELDIKKRIKMFHLN